MKFYILNNGIISEQGLSGSDQRVLHWSKIFASRGHSITMVVPEVGKARYGGFDCLITAKNEIRNALFTVFIYLKRALRASCILFKRMKQDNVSNAVIYSSSDLLPDSIPAIYNKIKNQSCRWIAGLHLIAPNPFKGFEKVSTNGCVFPSIANLYYFLTQRLILLFMKRHAHTIMVSNSRDKAFLLKKGFSPKQVIVTYGAVDWQEIDNAHKQGEEYSACYVGRFHKQKGFPDAIAAWKKACGSLPGAVLAVIGADINLNAMIKKVQTEGLTDNIKFLGFLSGAAKFNVMKSSKLCLFPSTYESFGMVVAEAFACGLPVVAYDLPIYNEIYPAGMLKASIGDISGLSKHIVSLLTNEILRQKISKEAYEASKGFTWEKTASDILERLQ